MRPTKIPRRSTASRRTGLTVVELLVAAALSAAMLSAMLSVLNRLAAQRAAALRAGGARPWREAAQELLLRDIQSARRIACGGDWLCLEGYGGRDFDSGAVTQRPAEIRYEIVAAGDYPWLVRHETHSDELSSGSRSSELLLCGARRLEVEAIEIDQTGSLQRVMIRSGEPRRMPRQLLLRVMGREREGHRETILEVNAVRP